MTFPHDFRSALRMPHSNHVENGRNVCWRRASVKKGATCDSEIAKNRDPFKGSRFLNEIMLRFKIVSDF